MTQPPVFDEDGRLTPATIDELERILTERPELLRQLAAGLDEILQPRIGPRPGFHERPAGDACPDCGGRWDDGAGACPICGLTIEAVAERIAAAAAAGK